jgi:hypothetical protein
VNWVRNAKGCEIRKVCYFRYVSVALIDRQRRRTPDCTWRVERFLSREVRRMLDIRQCKPGFTKQPRTVFYYSSGTYTDVLTSVNGCDSTVITNLTVNPAIDVTTTLNSITITANQGAATYQWIDCNNGNQPIAGATGQSFTATANGNYAVIITQNACSDTSVCVLILSVGTNSLSLIQAVNIYPNPSATGEFILILDKSSVISITDAR